MLVRVGVGVSVGVYTGVFVLERVRVGVRVGEPRGVVVRVGANYKVESETIDGQKAEHKDKDAFNIEYRVKVDKDLDHVFAEQQDIF